VLHHHFIRSSFTSDGDWNENNNRGEYDRNDLPPPNTTIKITKHERYLLISSMEYMCEIFRDMMKGLDVPDSDYFNRTYEQYQQLTSKVKNLG
jgi:hypothetical protein